MNPREGIAHLLTAANNNEPLQEKDPLSTREREGLQVDGIQLAALRDFRITYFAHHPDTGIPTPSRKSLPEVIAIINTTQPERYRLDPLQYIAVLDRYDELLREQDAPST